MRLKSYFANTVEAAISLASQELGPDALLMKSGPAMPEARYLGAYEVVFAAPEPGADTAPPVAKPARPEPAANPTLEKLMQDVADLRKQLERTNSAVAKAGRITAAPLAGMDPRAQEAASGLQAADLSAAAITRIVERRTANPFGPPCSLEDAVAAELPTANEIGKRGVARRMVAVVGPPGAGKTTTLVKLAVTHGLRCRRPVQILSADLYRIAAAEQLRSYAAILGVGFQTAETGLVLGQQLEEHRGKELVLIDTPGYGAREMDAAQELSEFFLNNPDIDTHLVLTATTKTSDLLAAADRYAIFRPSKLVFTRCDETEAFGQMVDVCYHTGLPVSFLGTGQQIPEDFEAAASRRLAQMVLGTGAGTGTEQSAWAAA